MKEVFNMSLSKAEFVAKVSDKTELTKKDSEKAVNAFLETIQETMVAGDTVSFVGFGSFEVRERAARKGRNPQTGEEIEIAASKVPAFKPGKSLKDAVNK
jgi:DNA-binding protein HU-beta